MRYGGQIWDSIHFLGLFPVYSVCFCPKQVSFSELKSRPTVWTINISTEQRELGGRRRSSRQGMVAAALARHAQTQTLRRVACLHLRSRVDVARHAISHCARGEAPNCVRSLQAVRLDGVPYTRVGRKRRRLRRLTCLAGPGAARGTQSACSHGGLEGCCTPARGERPPRACGAVSARVVASPGCPARRPRRGRTPCLPGRPSAALLIRLPCDVTRPSCRSASWR